jgi:plasmid stability protein
MSTMIQIRNVPDDVHRTLKSRAATAGMSLSDFILAEITQFAERPTIEELRKKWASRPRVALPVSPADILRVERDSR